MIKIYQIKSNLKKIKTKKDEDEKLKAGKTIKREKIHKKATNKEKSPPKK